MKSSHMIKSVVLAMVLAMVASTAAFAVPISVEVQSIFKLSRASDEGLLPFKSFSNTHEFRFRASDSGKWTLHLDTAASGAIQWNAPKFRAQLIASPVTFDVWGGGYNLGGSKHDPAELIVMGSAGIRPFAWGGVVNTVAKGQTKVRSSFKVADANITTDVHFRNANRTYVEAYGDYKLDAATIGGVLRYGSDSDKDLNTTALVGFVKTEVAGVNIGGSAGARFGDSIDGDNLAFGIVADTKLQDGALVLQGEFVNRQKNFYDDLAQDAAHQNGVERFKNLSSDPAKAEGRLIRFTGTWLGEANKSRPALSVLHSTSEATLTNLKGPAFQAIVQQTKDQSDEPEMKVVARAGSRFLENNLWAVGELNIWKDKDGVSSVAGVAGKDTRYQLRGRVRYNLNEVGWNGWFLLGIFDHQSTSDGNDTGSTRTLGAELWYDVGKVRVVTGLNSVKASNVDKATNTVSAEFRLKF
jgi:hypothetical protein